MVTTILKTLYIVEGIFTSNLSQDDVNDYSYILYCFQTMLSPDQENILGFPEKNSFLLLEDLHQLRGLLYVNSLIPLYLDLSESLFMHTG